MPLAIKASRTAAIMQPHQKEMAALQERIRQTSASRNPAALAKANREMKEFYGNLGVSPFGGLVGFLQLPITLGMFFAVKRMCDLPVEQLKYSGLEMFPDLTVTDPTLILPIAMTVAVNAQLLVCLISFFFFPGQLILEHVLVWFKRCRPKYATNDVLFPLPHYSWILHIKRPPCGIYDFARIYY